MPKNAPKEFKNRAVLWNAVEQTEKGCDAQTARECEVALPVELDLQEQKKLLHDYIINNFTKKGMCADICIHDTGNGNPRAHILLTTRAISTAGFGKKERVWNKKELLQAWWEQWAVSCNTVLKQKNVAERVDHRTLQAQGLVQEPTIHMGPAV